MITDEKFKEAIGKISDAYESTKDAVYKSNLNHFGGESEEIIKHLVELRDAACIALRASHTTENPNLN